MTITSVLLHYSVVDTYVRTRNVTIVVIIAVTLALNVMCNKLAMHFAIFQMNFLSLLRSYFIFEVFSNPFCPLDPKIRVHSFMFYEDS